MDADGDDFDKDPRILCKYADKCYQKNPAHHAKYKHPEKKRLRVDDTQGPSKRIKTDIKEDNDKKAPEPQETNELEMEDTTPKPQETNESEMEDTTKTIEETPIVSPMETTKEKPVILPGKLDKKKFIKSKFLVEMPEDFYKFWDLCKVINNKNPLLAFKEVGLNLVGPFEVLAGKFDKTTDRTKEEYLLHWRFFYDPPEFQTVITGTSLGYHIGYFRDSPSEMPVFLAENKAESNGIFTIIGENIFAATTIYLDNMLQSADPFKKMSIKRFIGLIQKEAKRHNFDLSKITSNIKKRDKAVVAKSFNKLGIVVPYDKKSELGYRELALSNRELKVLFEKLQKAKESEKDKLMVELEPVLRYASIATDECDFGTSLELGLDILYYGIEWMNPIAKRYLCSSYRLLNRDAFASIAEAHMNNRKKGTNLSII